MADQHLNFIVDKTEKFSTMLAESMGADNASSRKTTPNVSDAEMDENDEYEPDENSDDDEGKFPQCSNSRNFLKLRFYVKSILI